jgi:hypothetical protein
MVRRRFLGPVRARGDGFVVDLGDDETALVRRLVGELRQMLSDPAPDPQVQTLLTRLFPVVHPDDEVAEAEYQRLMREELVASKLASFDIVETALSGDGQLDEGGLIAFMQSVNSLRLVLGTMLGVTDDPDADEVDPAFEQTPEYALYSYLSWLLEHCVRALQ